MGVHFDLIGIAVRDMARSLAFYRVLGLAIPDGQEREAHVEFDAGGVRLAWDTVEMLRGVYGEWDDSPTGHRLELAFRCDSADDVNQTYTRVTEAGFTGYKVPWDAFWGQRYAIVEDPDGNLISIFA